MTYPPGNYHFGEVCPLGSTIWGLSLGEEIFLGQHVQFVLWDTCSPRPSKGLTLLALDIQPNGTLTLRLKESLYMCDNIPSGSDVPL